MSTGITHDGYRRPRRTLSPSAVSVHGESMAGGITLHSGRIGGTCSAFLEGAVPLPVDRSVGRSVGWPVILA